MKKLMSFLRLSWKSSPLYILLLVFQTVVNAGKLLMNIILPKFLVDELIGAKDVRTLCILGGLIVFNNVAMSWMDQLLKRFTESKKEDMGATMEKRMAEKIMNLEYSYLEDPYYLDLKERAVFAIHNQNAIVNLIQCVSESFTGAVTLIGLVTIIATLGPVMLLVLLVGVVIMLLFYQIMSKSMVEVMNELIPVNRKVGYYLDLQTEKQYQKDIRLYGMESMINKRTKKFLVETCDLFMKFYQQEGKSMGGISMVNDAVAAICYVYVGLRTVSDKFGSKISIGSLTMYVAAAISFTNSILKFGTSVVQTMQVLSFLDPYMEFMSLAEETAQTGKEPLTDPIESIEFSHVTFTYPKAEKAVLKDLTFSIHRGEKISIVGLNGAGKSTLVKLICRMYHADSGQILINGKDIYDYDYMSYMNSISAVFQDYRLFNFTIAENISCKEKDGNMERVNDLVDEVGLRKKVEGLKDGVQSRFGKEYEEDGIEMSGGEGQKVAIARALYKKASLVILDEPASALDPIAEAEIYEKFNSLVQDKTAIYISHRMSSSVFCDRILIIDGGTIADYDTHENLMKKTDSLYYKLFHSQAENYKLDPEDVETAS